MDAKAAQLFDRLFRLLLDGVRDNNMSRIAAVDSCMHDSSDVYKRQVDGIAKHLVRTLTRAKFEQLADRLIQACVAPCEQEMCIRDRLRMTP